MIQINTKTNKIEYKHNKILIHKSKSILVIAINKHSTLDFFEINKYDLAYVELLEVYLVEFVDRLKQVLANEIKNDFSQEKFDYNIIKLLVSEVLNYNNIHYLDFIFVFIKNKNIDKKMKNLKRLFINVIKEVSKC